MTAVVMAALVAYITFGGSKRVGRFAEIVVPVMAAAYIIVALIILALNITSVPAAFGLVFKSAFTPGSVFGGALGSAVIWGTKRAVYSSETGMSTATPSAGAAEVSHPAKQGLGSGVFRIHRHPVCLYCNRYHHDSDQCIQLCG